MRTYFTSKNMKIGLLVSFDMFVVVVEQAYLNPRIRKTLNLSACADSGTDIKMVSCLKCHVSHVTCH